MERVCVDVDSVAVVVVVGIVAFAHNKIAIPSINSIQLYIDS